MGIPISNLAQQGIVEGDLAIDADNRMWITFTSANQAKTHFPDLERDELHVVRGRAMGNPLPDTSGNNMSGPAGVYSVDDMTCRYGLDPYPVFIRMVMGMNVRLLAKSQESSVAVNPYLPNSPIYRVQESRAAGVPFVVEGVTLSEDSVLNPNPRGSGGLIVGHTPDTSGCTMNAGAPFPAVQVAANTQLNHYSTGNIRGNVSWYGQHSLGVDRRGLVYTLRRRSAPQHGFSVWARVNTSGALDPAGARLAEVVQVLSPRGSGDGQFNHPAAISFDSENRIYIADTLNHRVLIYEACRDDMSNCCDAGLNSAACTTTARPGLLSKIDGTKELGRPDGEDLRSGLLAPGGLTYPNGLSVDKDGNIWVVSASFVRSLIGQIAIRVQVFAPYRSP